VSDPSSRLVTLVLCTRDAALLGALPPYEAAGPYWPQTADVVNGARQRHGLDVTVLRLLTTERGLTSGGAVTYLAEVADAAAGAAAVVSWAGRDPLAEQPLRLAWARPTGPAIEVGWALRELDRLGRPATGPPQQVRTWNLSTLWRLPTAAGAVWLKVVPPFFGHEGGLIARLDPTVVPPLLSFDGPRCLLAELDGEDLDDGAGPYLLQMVDVLVGLQHSWSSRVEELLALGLPDWRAAAFVPLAERTIAGGAAELDSQTRSALDGLLTGLGRRLQDVADCGVPDTLVHGDFHPGNARGFRHGQTLSVRLLDWADAGVGHPLLDQAAFLQRRATPDLDAVRAHWGRRWREAVPGCDPERAADLLRPVAAVRQASIYQMFLENIEPDERVYHRGDPARWLRAAAQRFACEPDST
jgi:hypothetical protein